MATEYEELKITVSLDDNASGPLTTLRTNLQQLADIPQRASRGEELDPAIRKTAEYLKGVLALGRGFEVLKTFMNPVALGVAAVGYEFYRGLVALKNYTEEINKMALTAKQAGISFAELRNITLQLQASGIAVDKVTESIQGLNHSIAQLVRPWSELRVRLMEDAGPRGAAQMGEWIEKLTSAKTETERLNVAMQASRNVYENALAESHSEIEARDRQRMFMEEIGLNQAMIRRAEDLGKMTAAQTARYESLVKYSEQFESKWGEIHRQLSLSKDILASEALSPDGPFMQLTQQILELTTSIETTWEDIDQHLNQMKLPAWMELLIKSPYQATGKALGLEHLPTLNELSGQPGAKEGESFTDYMSRLGGGGNPMARMLKSLGLPGLQEGGIVNEPTLAMLGERGPEAVMPLAGSILANNTKDDAEATDENTATVNELTALLQQWNDTMRDQLQGGGGSTGGAGATGSWGDDGGGGQGAQGAGGQGAGGGLGTTTPGKTGATADVIAKAEQLAKTGNTGAVYQFIRSQGIPVSRYWCGEFVGAMVKSSGGDLPKGFETASSWLTWGQHVDPKDAQPGDIVVSKVGTYGGMAGRPLSPGQQGGHVGMVGSGGYDAKTGKIQMLQGDPWREYPMAVGNYEIRRAVKPEQAQQSPKAMAEGGIVTSPTHALLGEKGPELVVPLSRGGAGKPGAGAPGIFHTPEQIQQQKDFIARTQLTSNPLTDIWNPVKNRMQGAGDLYNTSETGATYRERLGARAALLGKLLMAGTYDLPSGIVDATLGKITAGWTGLERGEANKWAETAVAGVSLAGGAATVARGVGELSTAIPEVLGGGEGALAKAIPPALAVGKEINKAYRDVTNQAYPTFGDFALIGGAEARPMESFGGELAIDRSVVGAPQRRGGGADGTITVKHEAPGEAAAPKVPVFDGFHLDGQTQMADAAHGPQLNHQLSPIEVRGVKHLAQ